MKMLVVVFAVLMGTVLGWLGGSFLARERACTAVISGPASDNYPPALSAIAEAEARLKSGDTNVLEQLNAAQHQIEQAQRWTRRFLGQRDDAANGQQPMNSEANGTSATPGVRR